MTIPIELKPLSGAPPGVHYRWDTDTDIFTATLSSAASVPGPSGAVELEGTDGTWLVLELRDGRLTGVEIALWPDVHRNSALTAPGVTECAEIVVRASSEARPASVEVEAPIRAEADDSEQLVHFRIGDRRDLRSVRVGSNLLVDVDQQGCLAGLWFLNVPPFPAITP